MSRRTQTVVALFARRTTRTAVHSRPRNAATRPEFHPGYDTRQRRSSREALGGGTYDDLLRTAVIMPMFERVVQCAALEALIRMKLSAGRVKDFEAIAELEALRLDLKRPLDET